MQKYRVLIHGRNMLREFDGIRQRYGFYTNVFIEAFSAADAESRAVDVLREDTHLRNVALNAKNDPWTLSAEEVHEIEFDEVQLPRQGLALYEEKPDDTKGAG